jgi:hypothetical protein
MGVHAIVMRGTRILARPNGHPLGPVPAVNEVLKHFTAVSFYDHNGIRIITSSCGNTPEGWRWVGLIELQREVNDEMSESIGEAIFCGG